MLIGRSQGSFRSMLLLVKRYCSPYIVGGETGGPLTIDRAGSWLRNIADLPTCVYPIRINPRLVFSPRDVIPRMQVSQAVRLYLSCSVLSTSWKLDANIAAVLERLELVNRKREAVRCPSPKLRGYVVSPLRRYKVIKE